MKKRVRVRMLGGILLLLLTACGSAEPGIKADLLFVNGQLWTATENTFSPTGLAVAGERIIRVGSDADLRALAGPDTRVVDLQGRFLMPGFIDNHTHFVEGGFQLRSVDLRDAGDEQEFARRIGAHAGKLAAGEWIAGGDWDHEAWPSRRIPHRNLIDSLTPSHPVFVTRLDGHMGLANSLALKKAGVNSRTPDPAGGLIVRDESGEPTGMLKDAAMDLVTRVIPAPSDEELRQAVRTALAEAARLGVTTVNAMAGYRQVRTFQQLLRDGELTARIYAITPLPDFERLQAAGIERGFGGDFLKIGAVKGFVDGSLGSTTAWFYDPYLDEPSTSGLPSGMWFPEGNLQKLATAADAAGLQLAIHAIGDRANDELLDLFDAVREQNGEKDRRFRIEHAQHLTAEAIRRLGQKKAIASMQPYHAIDDGRWAGNRIGPQRIKATYAFRSLLDAGAIVTFGSDWTVAPLNPLLGVYAAVTRRTLDGANPEGWVPEQRITLQEALRCYTVNNAYAIFQEDHLGTLEEGKLADLAVLSASPFAVAPESLDQLQVEMTVVGGRVVYGDK